LTQPNYLALLNGVIITDLVVIVMLVFGIIESKSLKEWYNNFSLGGFISDIFSIMFCIVLAHFIYPYIFSEFKLINFIIFSILIDIHINSFLLPSHVFAARYQSIRFPLY
jgi:hypothetical protein